MDFAMPPFSSLVARFCATSTPVLQISKRLAAQSFMELWARSTAPKSDTLGQGSTSSKRLAARFVDANTVAAADGRKWTADRDQVLDRPCDKRSRRGSPNRPDIG
jgi:hypothetical protein